MSVVDGGLQVVVSCVGRSGGLYGSTFSGCATLRSVTFPDDAHLLSLVAATFRRASQDSSSEPAGWSPHLTPPLPASRSTAEGAVVFAYATALPMRVRDGALALTAMDAALVSRPFASVLVRDGQALEPIALGTSLQSAGLQGVGPAGPRARDLFERRDEVYAELYRVPSRYSELARDYYLEWFRSNGTIARCLPPTQQQFLAELGAAIS